MLCLAQEGSFSDYKQPNADYTLYRNGFDSFNYAKSNVIAFGSTSMSTPAGYYGMGRGLSGWPSEADTGSNGTSGFCIANLSQITERQPAYYDISFLYNVANGAPRRYRVDLYYKYGNGANNISLGTVANGGIIELSSSGKWLRVDCHRQQDLTDYPGQGGNYMAPSEIRVVAIQDETNRYSSFGVYSPSAALTIDNVRVTVPTSLSGMYKLSGGPIIDLGFTDLGLFSFNKSGASVGTYTNWVQTLLPTVNPVDVFGTQRIGTKKLSTNVLFASSILGVRQFSATTFNNSLNGINGSTSLGAGVNGNPTTDRYYSVNNYLDQPQETGIVRQVTTSVYSHYLRNYGGVTNTSEVPINLGNEKLVAIADLNCDGYDDYITKQGTNLRYRLFQGTTGSNDNLVVNLSAPALLSPYGNLTVFTSADLNNDGFMDLVLQDPNSGDVFSLICSPNGGTLKWLFNLNSNEKLVAVVDADNDHFPDIYCKRDFSNTVGKLTIRKMSQDGLSVLTYDLLCEYANAVYAPAAVGDINGDGSADVVFVGNDAPYYSVYNALVNPATRNILGQYWICSAGTPTVRPIYYMGSN